MVQIPNPIAARAALLRRVAAMRTRVPGAAAGGASPIPSATTVAGPLPAARRVPVRRPSPVDPTRRAEIEDIITPLWDTEAISSGNAGETVFFSRPIGQASIAGCVKTLRDTNMELASQLPHPRVQVVTGIRVVPSQITNDQIATPDINTPDYTDYVSTVRGLIWESILQINIADKPYLKIPMWMAPGNVGIQPTGGAMFDVESAGATPTEAQLAWSFFPRGDYFSLLPGRINLPPGQSFSARIIFPRSSANSIAVPLKVTVVLDGMQGREVM